MSYLGRLHRYRRLRGKLKLPPPPTCLEIGPGSHPSQRHIAYTRTWDKMDCITRPGITLIARWGYDRIPAANNTYDLVYSSHTLEHVPWWRAVFALKEAFRVLKPGGVAEIWVPNFQTIIEAWLSGKPADGWHKHTSHRSVKLWANGRIFGAGDGDTPESDAAEVHRAAYDGDHLMWCLRQAGFSNVRLLTRDIRSKSRAHKHINLGARGVKLLKSRTMDVLRRKNPGMLAREVR